MKSSMMATGLVAATLLGTCGAGYCAFAAQPRDAEKAATPTQNNPAATAGAVGPVPTAIEPGRDRVNPPASKTGPGGSSPRVLWAKLKAAAAGWKLAREAHAAARGKYDQVVAARGEVEAFVAELNSRADDLRDEGELLQAQLEIRKADLHAAEAQLAKVVESQQAQEKLVKGNVISNAEVRRSQMDVDIRTAELSKKRAELNELMLRIKQATRRRDEAIELAKQANALAAEHEAAPAPAAPTAKQ